MKKGKLFYGWWIVLAGAMFVGTAIGFFVNCNSVFVKPVTADLGLSRAAFTLTFTISGLVGMLVTVVYGDLYRKYPVRRFMFVGAVITSVCYFAYSFATQVWHFYVLAAVMGLFMPPISVITVSVLLNKWFLEKRGLATGLAFAGSGLTAAIMAPTVSAVIESHGWRWGYRLIGVAGFVLMMFAVLVLVREQPSDLGLLPLGAKSGSDGKAAPVVALGITRAQAVKEPALYLTILGMFVLSMVSMGISPHCVSYFRDIGYDATVAASFYSTALLVMTFAKIILAVTFEKIGTVASGIVLALCALASALSLAFAKSSPIMPWVFAVSFGFGYATTTVGGAYLISENFGTKEYSAIYGLGTTFWGFGGTFGTPLSGLIFDKTGSYMNAWMFYAVIAVVGMVALAMAGSLSLKKGFNPLAKGSKGAMPKAA